MVEIFEKAGKYAEGKVNEAVTKAVAQAYMDGFRDGYNTREEEIPVDFRGNKTEYVDLGLQSGILWAADYEKEEKNIVYLPFGKASLLTIPTEEQWQELKESCRWTLGHDGKGNVNCFNCIGPNGNILKFNLSGYYDTAWQSWSEAIFWIKDLSDANEKNAVRMYLFRGDQKEIYKYFSGYKLPIRLVRPK